MKIYIGLSLFINLLLCSVYYKSYYFEKHFHNYEEMENAMTRSTTILQKDGKNMVKGVQSMLKKRKEIKAPINSFFQCSHESTVCLFSEINTLLQSDYIDDISFQNAIEMSLLKRQEIKDAFAQTFGNKVIMKKSKLRQDHVDIEIEAANKSCFLKPHFAQYDLTHLSQKEKRFILHSMALDLQNIHTDSGYKIASLIGGGCCLCLRKYFPVIFPKKHVILKDEVFEAEIAVGAYSSEFAKKTSIFWDGKRILLKDGVATLKIEAKELGYQKHQGVLTAMDEDRNRFYTDTTYFQFYVTP